MRGVALRSSPPYINYPEIGKSEEEAAHLAHEWGGGVIHVPVGGVLHDFDPASMAIQEQGETMPLVFEALTRDIEGGRVVPWLASEVIPEDGGARFRFRLRRGLRFHDGRGVSARDVRYSFERLLQKGRGVGRFLLAPVRGAQSLIDGKASDLEGFHIVSPSEFVIELEKPLSFFPVLVSYPAAGIVPEGTGSIGESWRKGCIGTGAYRVASFEPGKRLELERNPTYWREGYPKNEGVVFRFGVPPEEIRSEFLAGRFSIASDLLPTDAEALRQDPRFRATYRESPSLVTYFVIFNIPRCLRGRADAPGGRAGDRRRGHREANARPACDSGQRPHPARPTRVRLEAEEPAPDLGTGLGRAHSLPRDDRRDGRRESRSCSESSAPSRRSSPRHFARWAIRFAS